MKPFINYIGGKQRLAKEIIRYFPEHDCYVEVFGGSGALLFAKKPSRFEKYNDIDDDIVNLFRQVRSNCGEFQRNINLLPQSRSEYDFFRKDKSELSELERAVRTYFLFKNGFSGKPGGGFSASAKHKGRYDMEADFAVFSRRLSRVTIECLDFGVLVPKYDGAETFFFADPPYFRVPDYYRNGFTEGGHRRLSAALAGVKGKWLLCYDDCDWVRTRYGNFRSVELPVRYSAALTRKVSSELLIANYPLEAK